MNCFFAQYVFQYSNFEDIGCTTVYLANIKVDFIRNLELINPFRILCVVLL